MPVPTAPVSLVPKGVAFGRFIQALGANVGRAGGALLVAQARMDGRWQGPGPHWRDTPQVLAALEVWQTKAAVPAGSSRDATWGGPLAPLGLATEALTILRSLSIFETLAPRLIRVPLHCSIPHETGVGAVPVWIAEGAPVRFQKSAFETVLHDLFKIGVGELLTKELMNFSTPGAEETITRTILTKLAKEIDNQLLSPSVAAVAGTNPASITNGATAITSTGTTAAQITADLNAMVAAIATPGGGLTWIMRKKTMATIAGALGAMSGLPQTLYALPVIVSDNGPQQVTLVDGQGVIYSDAGQFDVDVSDEVTLQVDDVPAAPPVAASVMQSTWRMNEVAVKALRWLNWQRVETGS